MEWVHGVTLDRYIERYLRDGVMLEKLRNSFAEMYQRLLTAGVAHGDLQHGNILVTASGDLRLVDYDGMFVPSMKGLKSNELGHRNYQHPERNASHFDETIDTFAAWSIYTAVTVAAHFPDVYVKLNGGNDCLLFRRKDYEDVWSSPAFAEIDSLNLTDLKRLSNGMKWLATSPCARQIAKSAPLTGGSISRARPDASSEVEQWWTDYLKDKVRPSVLCNVESELQESRRHAVLREPSLLGAAEIGLF
ncbi:MAG: hypothetical protein K2W95_33225 [Candidatus Obscuribacterales bacterium]|nr:hypothetical protein [Candidatus Obscuribacterales bacterium]